VADSVGAISIGSAHEKRLRSAATKLYYFSPTRWYSLDVHVAVLVDPSFMNDRNDRDDTANTTHAN
jgi:hypothetical protein